MTNIYCSDINTIEQTKKVGRRRLTQAQFIERCIKKHGLRFDYSEVMYKGALVNVKVTCNECKNIFYPQPANHMNGTGCPDCNLGAKTRDTQAQFVSKAIKKHGDQYDYSEAVYKNSRTKVLITCLEHGLFSQTPHNHLSGYGCKDCGNKKTTIGVGGYGRSDFKRICDKNNDGNATLYVIECYNDNEVFFKIGITSTSLKRRFARAEYMPYSYNELFMIIGESDYIYDLEVRLHALLSKQRYEPSISFAGYTECFKEIASPVDKILKELSST